MEKIKVEREKVLEKVKEKRGKTVKVVTVGAMKQGCLELPKCSDDALNRKHRLFIISSELLAESGEKTWKSCPATEDKAFKDALLERINYAKAEAKGQSDVVLVTDARSKGVKKLIEATLGITHELIVIFGASPRLGSSSGWMTLCVAREQLLLSSSTREDKLGVRAIAHHVNCQCYLFQIDLPAKSQTMLN